MQLNNTYRAKLLNAILFFAKAVKLPSKVKIFKLLFFLDFEHFKQTGRSVTNLDYYAWNFGPVPREFFFELCEKGRVPEDFNDALTLMGFKAEHSGKEGATFGVKRKADLSVFSPREQKIMKDLVEIWKDADGDTISEYSHLKNQPWDRTKREKGLKAKIDYALALDDGAKVTAQEAEEAMRERDEMLKAFPLFTRLHER